MNQGAPIKDNCPSIKLNLQRISMPLDLSLVPHSFFWDLALADAGKRTKTNGSVSIYSQFEIEKRIDF